jgi:hypothetical protein
VNMPVEMMTHSKFVRARSNSRNVQLGIKQSSGLPRPMAWKSTLNCHNNASRPTA